MNKVFINLNVYFYRLTFGKSKKTSPNDDYQRNHEKSHISFLDHLQTQDKKFSPLGPLYIRHLFLGPESSQRETTQDLVLV